MSAGRDQPPADHLRIGRLGKTFGLEGGLRFHPLGEAEAGALTSLRTLFVIGLGEVALERVRPHGGGLVIHLEGVRRVEQAKALVNADVYAARHALPAPAQHPYTDALLGSPVSLDGRPYGRVVDLLPAGPQALLVVDSGDGEVLVPSQAPYVRYDEGGVALVDPPEGLLEP